MRQGYGRVKEVFLDPGGAVARLTCDPGLVPPPGQYLHAFAPAEPDAPLAESLFPAGYAPDGFDVAGPWPSGWAPGTILRLRGPLGRGFALPASARRVALAAPAGPVGRLLPLIEPALARGAAVLLMGALTPRDLPASVELLPLSDLPEARRWADYLALDLPRERLADLRSMLGLRVEDPWPAGAQVLVRTPMPCMGLGACAVCAVDGRLACVEGPVFSLTELTVRL